jgi:N-acetylneuraminic acid mutarotase
MHKLSAHTRYDNSTFCRAWAMVLALAIVLLAACSGAGSGSGTPNTQTSTYTVNSGVAEKGPLIKGSTVTAQELDAALSPTGKQYTYQINSDLGTFSPTSPFGSHYIGLNATGYYFDEVANAISTGTVALNGYSDLTAESVLNVNLLTTLAYQRIQHLVTNSSMTFAAARTQAESEVLAALNIPSGGYGSFATLDLGGGTDGDHILAAISSLFVYGNSAGSLSELIANFQSDIGANGVITNPTTAAALVAAAKAINPAAVAANLTKYYATPGVSFTAADISAWIAQSGDGVIGKFAFQVPDATPSTIFTFPASVVSQFAGTPISVTAGQLSVNGTPASGTVSFKVGDVVTLSPHAGDFPNGLLASYLVTGSRNLARVSFGIGLLSIAVTPKTPSVPEGLTQQFTATGTFTDTSTANLTNTVAWTSGTPATAPIDATSGLAHALEVGETVITATSGSVSGSTTLNVMVVTNAWGPAASMPNNVAANTATLLSNGRVLVAGGRDPTQPGESITSAAEVYDLATNSWSSTSNMSEPRDDHTATPLPNGKVLAAGGQETCNACIAPPTAGTDLYDPVANTWVAGATMATARESHSATLLANGKVLVVGGLIDKNCDCDTSSAELYDPVSNTWSSAGAMSVPRVGHTATLLANGKVLVAGGGNSGDGQGLATAELYDPIANAWVTAGSMATARRSHTATLLRNGKVLVAGGGIASGVITAAAELYDPAADTWVAAGGLATARESHSATLLANGKVLVAGGSIAGGVTASAELYDAATNMWSSAGNMLHPHANPTATLLPNGQVLVAGEGTAELYYP